MVKTKVIVVDDDALIRDMLSEILLSDDFSVLQAENGRDALEKYRLNKDAGLIISDMNMPVMNGLELIKEIRSIDANIPLIILTGSHEVRAAVDAIAGGASDYLFKDESVQDTILLSVKKVLEKQRIEQQNKRLMKELQETLSHMNAIMENMADGLLVTDAEGGISLVNPAIRAMLDVTGEVRGRSCRDVFGDELAELLEKSRGAPDTASTVEIKLSGKRVGKAVASAINKKTASGGGEDVGSVVIVRDTTFEKEVDRMKTDFISTVSHELRTPLTSVLGFAEVVRKKFSDVVLPMITTEDKKVVRTLRQITDNMNIIVSEGERLTALINDVLDIAKMEAGKMEWRMEPLSVADVLERAVAATSALFEKKGLAPVMDMEEGLPHVTGDRDRLLQVVINFISNAVKFAAEGAVKCSAKRVGGEVVVSVEDSGVGITAEDLPMVFEKFKQVGDVMTDKPMGTGLGLPICKEIIERHGGRIWAESEPGRGSVFSFALPVAAGEQTAREQDIGVLIKQLNNRIPAAPVSDDGKKTVLVVDDEEFIRELLKQLLDEKGYDVMEAKDGLEALEMVKKKKPDIITLDVMMPGLSGFDVSAVLKSAPETADIPIIILSIIEDKDRGYRLGIDKYHTKPINAEALMESIETLLSKGKTRKKALIIDKDDATIKTVRETLMKKGFDVFDARNGKEGIQKAVELRPDIVIVDSNISNTHDIVGVLKVEKQLRDVVIVAMAEGTLTDRLEELKKKLL